MCDLCLNIKDYQYDPSRTTILRNQFASSMKRRFKELERVVVVSVDTNDCFGVREMRANVQTNIDPIPSKDLKDRDSKEKIETFMIWLRKQAALGILGLYTVNQIGRLLEQPWTDTYIESAYKNGIARAYIEMKKAGYAVPSLSSVGGVEALINTPIHAEKLGIVLAKTYSDLRGIVENMDMQMARVLAKGISEGKNPRLLAKELSAVISKKDGVNLTGTLGKFVTASRRAELLARTEIIRAYNDALLTTYRDLGAPELGVMAEWVTTGARVCPICESMEGQLFSFEEAEGMLPAHPLCKCIFLPAKIN